MRRSVSLLIPLFIGLGIFLILLIAYFLHKEHEHPLNTSFYIWQSQWNPPVNEAVAQAKNMADSFMVFAAEIHCRSGLLERDIKQPDWSVFSSFNSAVIPVIRMGDSLAPYLSKNVHEAADPIEDVLQQVRDSMEEFGIVGKNLQFDYDCPTSKLADYATLMTAIHKKMPETSLSITALPTWLDDPDFEKLVGKTDYYVLQVHALEKPNTVEDDVCLHRSIRASGDMQKAERIGVPYYLAFPTYGYQLLFDSNGNYSGIYAEDRPSRMKSGFSSRVLMADPHEVADDVQYLQNNSHTHCLGIAWFRLPVASDRLNWSWSTWLAVNEGCVPKTRFQAEIRDVSDGLYELWVYNTGERNVFENITFQTPMKDYPLLAYDCLNGYRETQPGELTGPAPRQNEPLLAAWYRALPSANIQSSTFVIKLKERSEP